MALSVPVIALAVMGTCEIVNARRGAVVPEDDEVDFASNIVKVTSDGELLERLAREAQDYAREWQSGVIAGKLVSLYERVVDRDSSACAGVQPA